jgi:putative ABC transport system permease protein
MSIREFALATPERVSDLTSFLELIRSDLRLVARGSQRRKSFAAAVILTLALGIGTTCLMFSVVSSVLLTPLDFPNADRLAWVGWKRPKGSSLRGPSLGEVVELASQARSIEGIAGYAEQQVDIKVGQDFRQLRAGLITGSFFQVLGRAPQRGRWILPSDDIRGIAVVAVISDDCWRELFNRDPRILGRQLSVDGLAVSVVGVMPARFAVPSNQVAVWLPIRAKLSVAVDAHPLPLEGSIARVGRSGFQSASAELASISKASESPSDLGDRHPAILPLRRVLVGDVGTSLVFMLFTSLLVLCITCVNAASLLIAREVTRQHDYALRRALGATTKRLIQQLATETLLLTTLGAVLGAVFAFKAIPLVSRLGAELIPRATEIEFNGQVFFFVAAMVLISALGVIALPAWAIANTDPGVALRKSAAGVSASSSMRNARQGVVALQVSLTKYSRQLYSDRSVNGSRTKTRCAASDCC